MRIVSICRSLPTPAEPTAGVFVLNRIAALAELADVTVLQPVPYLPGVRPLPEWAREPMRHVGALEIRHAPMPYVPGVLKSLHGRWLARAIEPALRALQGRGRIDALDAHFGHPDGVGAVSAGAKLGIPAFVTLRGYEEDRIRERIVGPQLAAALRRADGCVAVSNTLRTLAVRHGVEPERVCVVQNAIDSRRFAPGDRVAARARLGVPQQRRLVVSVGRLVELKRHHVLVAAVAELRRRGDDVALAIIGGRSYEPDYPDRLRRDIASLGVDGAVTLVGDVPQSAVVDWLHAADAFSLLSSREGCCNAVLEALAVGLPCVVTPAGDNPEFVRPGVDGEIVPVDDAPATARALGSVLARRDWNAAEISARLGARVGTWRAVAERVLAFFDSRLAAGAGTHRKSA